MKKIIFGAFVALSLSGCITLTASKSLIATPEPGQTEVAVTANAVTRCRDYFVFYRCTLNVDVRQNKPVEVTEPESRRRRR